MGMSIIGKGMSMVWVYYYIGIYYSVWADQRKIRHIHLWAGSVYIILTCGDWFNAAVVTDYYRKAIQLNKQQFNRFR